MIVSENLKYVWSSLPRTGTCSMVAFLRRNCLGHRYSYHHQSTPPTQYKNYFRFCVVRHPYKRLFSYWKWCVSMGKDPRKPKRQDSFTDFLKYMLEHQEDVIHRNVYWWINQSQFVDKFKPHIVLKLEDIKTDIKLLPFVKNNCGSFFKRNQSIRMTYELSNKEKELMALHSHRDLERFNYGD